MVGRHETAPLKRDSHRARNDRKRRVLTRHSSSATEHIADAVVVKEGNLFLVCQRDGRVPLQEGHGFGLYCDDCRFLDGYDLRVCGVPLSALGVDARRGFCATIELTNGDLRDARGRVIAAKEQLGVRWKRAIDGKRRVLHEVLTLHNFGATPMQLAVSLSFRARFEDVFEVRGLLKDRHGKRRGGRWHGPRLGFDYTGVDGVLRALRIDFHPAPRRRKERAEFALRIAPGADRHVSIALRVLEGDHRRTGRQLRKEKDEASRARGVAARAEKSALAGQAAVESDNLALEGVIGRSLRDLRTLRNSLRDETYLAAGIPWFSALFGRDSLISALFTLAFDASLAEETLRLLAAAQGTQVDGEREEEPGKILHELRVGELAASHQIPHTPYYGTIDATPLFLITLASHARWSGRLDLFRELEPNVVRALEWIDRWGDRDGDGYVEYYSAPGDALVNQGWKDSGDAIVCRNGRTARPPIALVEVQGYVYYAQQLIAELYALEGDEDRARRLLRSARALRARFNRDYWYAGERTYDLARQLGGERTRVVSSNAGHALWTGIAEAGKAKRVARRLLEDDLFSGWGVRTLSTREACYNPLSYHRGSVWPHDNAIIVAGLRRYGRDDEALRIFEGVLQASRDFDVQRLPELFCGFSRDEYEGPVRYPVACHPQAWAAAAMPYMLTTMLGLVPDAFAGELRIVRPILPRFMHRVVLRRLRIGSSEVDLLFERQRSGRLVTRVLRREGRLSIKRSVA